MTRAGNSTWIFFTTLIHFVAWSEILWAKDNASNQHCTAEWLQRKSSDLWWTESDYLFKKKYLVARSGQWVGWLAWLNSCIISRDYPQPNISPQTNWFRNLKLIPHTFCEFWQNNKHLDHLTLIQTIQNTDRTCVYAKQNDIWELSEQWEGSMKSFFCLGALD